MNLFNKLLDEPYEGVSKKKQANVKTKNATNIEKSKNKNRTISKPAQGFHKNVNLMLLHSSGSSKRKNQIGSTNLQYTSHIDKWTQEFEKNVKLQGLCNMLDSSAKYLKTITLDLERCFDISEKGLIAFCRDLQDLRPLLSLEISFKSYYLHLDAVNGFPSADCETLYLLQRHSAVFEKQGLCNLGTTFKTLSSLEKLNFKLGWGGRSQVSNTGLIALTEFIKRQILLQKLTCIIEGFEVTDEGYSQLFKTLKRLTQLRELNLRIRCKKEVPDLQVQKLVETVKALVLLEKIKIFVYSKSTTAKKHLKNLEKNLKKRIPLENVSIECGVL